jgi:hypothetical protein
LADIAAAVDLLDQSMRLEPLGHSDRVAGTAFVIQFLDCTEYEPVILAVEIRLGNDIRDLVKGAGGKKQAPEYRLFALD